MPRLADPINPDLIPAPGMVFKDYPTLARALNQPVLMGGASRKKQWDRWSKQITMERREDNTILIKPYTPPPIVLKNEPKWSNNLAPLIIFDLHRALGGQGNTASKHFNQLLITSTEAFIEFGLCNWTWIRLKDGSLEGFELDSQFAFMEQSFAKFYDILYECLRQLRKKKLIQFTREHLIEQQGSLRLATEEESRWVSLAKDNLLLRMGVAYEYQLHRRGLVNEFYLELSKWFSKTFAEVDNTPTLQRKVWRIFCLKETLLRKEVRTLVTLDYHKTALNLESARWHYKTLGKEITELVIPTEALLLAAEETEAS